MVMDYLYGLMVGNSQVSISTIVSTAMANSSGLTAAGTKANGVTANNMEKAHTWEGKVGTKMLMLKQDEWIDMFKRAGFSDVEGWRANQTQDWAGTLVLTGKKN